MRSITPLRLGICGGGFFVAGLVWFAIWLRSVRGWIQVGFDVHAPLLLRLLVIVGFWLLLGSLVWGAASWVRRKRA